MILLIIVFTEGEAMIHKFIIPGIPTPYRKVKESDRRDYDEQRIKQSNIAIEVENIFGDRRPLQGPLHLDITFFFPVPRNAPIERIRNTPFPYKPSMDRLTNFLLDAVVGVLIETKNNISSSIQRKMYDINPRTEFTLIEIKHDKTQS